MTSIDAKPQFDSRLINSILSLVCKKLGSCCNPSLGPTSTILIDEGMFFNRVETYSYLIQKMKKKNKLVKVLNFKVNCIKVGSTYR